MRRTRGDLTMHSAGDYEDPSPTWPKGRAYVSHLKRTVAALSVAGLSFGLAPLADPADAHAPGGHHLSNCYQFVNATGRPFQPGDGPNDGCVKVIQSWLNTTRFMRLAAGRPVPAAWSHLTIDGDWGSLTSAAMIVFQDLETVLPINGLADEPTMYNMRAACMNIAFLLANDPAECDDEDGHAPG
jgi:hypothetical protein